MQLQSRRRIRLALLLAATVLSPAALLGIGCVMAQTQALDPMTEADPANEPAAETAPPVEARADDFKALSEQWKVTQQQLENLAKNYRQADRNQREKIMAQYRQLAEGSQELLTRLRAAALANYQAEPNKSTEVVAALLGFIAHDLEEDRVDEAWELGQVLTKHECKAALLSSLLGVAAYARDDFDEAQRLLKQAEANKALTEEAAICLQDVEQALPLWQAEQKIRQQETEADDLPRVRLETTEGVLTLELFENEAPQTVGNFVSLVESGFYDGLTFHRVLPGFMAQAGCPEGTGSGGPGYRIFCESDEPNHRNHFRAVLSMAKTAAPDTGGSQFFITFRRTPHLDGKHTVFGRVIEGHEVLAKLQRRDPTRPGQAEPDLIVKAEVLRKRNHPYEPAKVPEN